MKLNQTETDLLLAIITGRVTRDFEKCKVSVTTKRELALEKKDSLESTNAAYWN